MSLGDGLARALRRYRRAKADYGLKALLTGDYNTGVVQDVSDCDEKGEQGGNGSNGRKKGSGNGSTLREGAGSSVPSRLDSRGIHWQQAQYKVLCPDCQNALRFGEGCVTCDACGFSEC